MAILSERNAERDKMITMTAISYQCKDIIGPMNNLIPVNRQQNEIIEIIGRTKIVGDTDKENKQEDGRSDQYIYEISTIMIGFTLGLLYYFYQM